MSVYGEMTRPMTPAFWVDALTVGMFFDIDRRWLNEVEVRLQHPGPPFV